MGADGHIVIYDLGKLEQSYLHDAVEDFLGFFLSSKLYKQELSGKKYLTKYWGDNIYHSDMYDTILGGYNPDKDDFSNKGEWSIFGKYDKEEFMKLSKKQRKSFYEMVKYLESECRLTSWEVWT